MFENVSYEKLEIWFSIRVIQYLDVRELRSFYIYIFCVISKEFLHICT